MIHFSLKKVYKKYKFHILIWCAYIIYEVSVLGFAVNSFRPLGDYFVVYTANITIFYAHAVLLKRILNNGTKSAKIIQSIILLVALVVIYPVFTYLLIILGAKTGVFQNAEIDFFTRRFLANNVYRALLFIGYATTYVFIIKSFEDRAKVEELERRSLVNQIERQTLENDLIQSQNNYLRSQINPHFLFNTLNFIYNDARKKAPMAADAIMNLAEMMRYALKRPEASELVPLNEEVEQIEHLINLHRLRTVNTINLKLEIVGDLFGIRFPPLILLTLVENVFKHGNVSHSTQPALIKIVYENNNLNITTINMVNDNKGKEAESHHVGIDNINKRLANFYGEEYIFRYYKDPLNRFITEIDLNVVNPLVRLNT